MQNKHRSRAKSRFFKNMSVVCACFFSKGKNTDALLDMFIILLCRAKCFCFAMIIHIGPIFLILFFCFLFNFSLYVQIFHAKVLDLLTIPYILSWLAG